MIRLLLMLVVALIAAPVATGATLRPEDDQWQALTQIASQTAGEPVSVNCEITDDLQMDWMPSHVWGYTYPGDPAQITISQLVCAGLLYALVDPTGKLKWQLYTYRTPGYGTDNSIVEGYALHVFTHELRHVIVGYSLFVGADDDLARTEHDAECYATAQDTKMALRFGMTRKRARQMHIYGGYLHNQLPPSYREGACP